MKTQNQDKILLEWQVHLARECPSRTFVAGGIILLAACIVLLSSKNPLLAFLTVLVLLSALSEFLFMIQYRLTERGIFMRNFLTVRRMPWEDVRRCYRGRQGIKLSPLAHGGWREAFRGIHIWVTGEEQEKVVEIIRQMRPAPAKEVEV